MRSVKVALAALLSTTILFGASAALAAEWRLTEVTGRVRVAVPGQTPATGAPNQAVPVGADITTAAGGRAVLTNGVQRMVIGPNSRMTVANGEGAGMTRIMQDLGSILFQVDKQARPHFRVDTPLLAAVVKGTTFTVSIGATSDTVHVAEGLVEVRANGGGGPQDIPAGVTGRVMRDGPAQVGVITPTASPAPAETVQALPPLDYSQVSDGVVAGPGAPVGLDLARSVAAPQGQSALSAASDVGNVGSGNSDSGVSSMAAARATAAAIGQAPAQIAANGNAPPAFAAPSQGGGNGGASNPNGSEGVPGNGNGGPAGNPNGPEGANPGNGNGNGPGANNGAGNGNGGPAGNPNGPEGANPGNGNGNGPGANNGVGNGNGGPAGNPNGPEGANPGNGNGNGPGANNGVGNGNGGPTGNPNGPDGAAPGNGNGDGPGANNAGGNGNGNGNGGAATPPAPEPGPGNGNGPGANNGVGNGAASGGDSPGFGKGGKGKAG